MLLFKQRPACNAYIARLAKKIMHTLAEVFASSGKKRNFAEE